MKTTDTILTPLRSLKGYNSALDALRSGSLAELSGIIESAKAHIAYGLIADLGERAALFVASGEKFAKALYEDLNFFSNRVMYYPLRDIVFYNADVRSINITRERLAVLDALARGENPIIVLSAEALLDKLASQNTFASASLELGLGQMFPLSALGAKLQSLGYERVEMVEAPGQFAIRGGILDIYTTLYDAAIRIEFWDDELDSMRLMDTQTQRSIEKLETVRILPMREFICNQEELPQACKSIRAELEAATEKFSQSGNAEALANLQTATGEHLAQLEQGATHKAAERYLGYFETASLLSYMPKSSLIFFDEPARLSEHIDKVVGEFSQSMNNKLRGGYILPGQVNNILSWNSILEQALGFSCALLMNMPQQSPGFPKALRCEFKTRQSISNLRSSTLPEMLRKNTANQWRTLILCASRTRAQRLAEELVQNGISSSFREDASGLSQGVVVVSPGGLAKSFEYPEAGFAIISDKETKSRRLKRRRAKGRVIESFAELSVGDRIVHDNHGIGVYRGIERIIADDITRDYIKLLYADEGVLYVPTSQIDIVQKYIGSESAKLNKLGGGDWARAKARTKKSVSQLAEQLVMLYAQRNAAKGHSFGRDNIWQSEFEEVFPYEETEDQLAAISDVKRDMEAPIIMDRLICGDVGYGKTEIAIRAAFKAVQDSKQVAYLVPTTILAQQHFSTFTKRMENYPIRIEMLSRFRTKNQQAQTLARLRSGQCDIVIGTHRLLSKDIAFKDLGLLIVDEEQRFGVAHKEKLKALRHNVDVLTLTATPIPRTLHMSLTGIRDMSILEEPPSERQPVQTYVMEHNPESVRDALRRELARGGQVFYLNNRVRNIHEVAARMQELVPEASVAYAHGQMSEVELEDIMAEFIAGEIDILVCTTIIETGLDIPNANTMIIQDADSYGLAQLYQLRGRVGRSNRQAYAYFMYRRDKALREEAEQRLQTIREFTEFGSGLRIAMRDMELRGAGNILGDEQHGHMDAVGYEMYCRFLDEAMRHIQGGEAPGEQAQTTTIELDIDAYIPPSYIGNESQKLDIYKKISLIRSEADYFDAQEELEDRFGTIPPVVANLLEIALIKALASRAGVVSVSMRANLVYMTFRSDANVDPELLISEISKSRGRLGFKAAVNPIVTYACPKDAPPNLAEMRDFLKRVV